VRDEDDGSVGVDGAADELEDRRARRGIEVSGRLVREENRRRAGDGSCDGDALLLTAPESCDG